MSLRKYIRHPSDIPIEFAVTEARLSGQRLANVSVGGIAVRSGERVEIGRLVEISIALVTPPFRAVGRVAWCLRRADYYDIGLQFIEQDDAYRARMVEQICHIEQYRNDVLRNEGRCLSGEEAAMEWIRKYAADFPQVSSD